MNKKLWAAIILIIITVAAILFFRDNQYVAKIGGSNVSLAEFEIYLYEHKVDLESRGGKDIWEFSFEGVSTESIAKQNALDSIAYVKIAVMQADRMGITLSKEEIAEAEAEADLYITSVSKNFNIDHDTAINVTKEMFLRNKVHQAITDSYELSEPDFIAYYEDYLKTSRDKYLSIEIQYVFIAGLDEAAQKKAGEARGSIYNGMPFETVVKEFSDDYDESKGVVIYTQIPSSWDEALYNAAYELNQGEISEIIGAKNGYYILYAKNLTFPDMDELKNSFREDYIQQKKQEIYEQEYEKWSRSILIRKNEKIWNNITIPSYLS